MCSRIGLTGAGMMAAFALVCRPLAGAQPDSVLETLLADYRAYELPLPPKDARLAIAMDAFSQPYLLLVIRTPTTDRPGLGSPGFGQTELTGQHTLKFVSATPPPLERLESQKPVLAYWTSELGLAIQCYSLGWEELARALLERDHERSIRRTDQDPKDRARDCLFDMAWEYCRCELCNPRVDRRIIAQRMRKLLGMKRHSLYWGRDGMRDLYDDLLATLKPSQATPGSPEELLDQLRHFGAPEFDGAYDKLEVLALEAIPVLLDHIDDRRLTRKFDILGIRTGKGRARIVRIGSLSRALLRSVAGESEYETWWTLDECTWRQSFDREKAEAWLQQARSTGEEEYFVKRLFPPPDDEGKVYPNRTAMRVLIKKYPERLRREYQRALAEIPGCETRPIADLLRQTKEEPGENGRR